MSVFREDALAGKVALITGGGSGICRGIAEAYARHGADVAIVSRNLARNQQTATEIQAATGREVIALQADVREEETLRAAVAATIERFGRLDILVNGAAGNFLCPASQLKAKGYRTVLEIDAVGTFSASRAAFDLWFAEHGGSIINISATLQYLGTPLQIHAASAKAAIDTQTKILAVEWGSMGIRVNGIAPGPIDDTEGMSRLAPPGYKERLVARIPIRRYGKISEIADVAVFLASDAASLLNGAIVVADGGAWLDDGTFSLIASGG